MVSRERQARSKAGKRRRKTLDKRIERGIN